MIIDREESRKIVSGVYYSPDNHGSELDIIEKLKERIKDLTHELEEAQQGLDVIQDLARTASYDNREGKLSGILGAIQIICKNKSRDVNRILCPNAFK